VGIAQRKVLSFAEIIRAKRFSISSSIGGAVEENRLEK
jgi:hypothetical protein